MSIDSEHSEYEMNPDNDRLLENLHKRGIDNPQATSLDELLYNFYGTANEELLEILEYKISEYVVQNRLIQHEKLSELLLKLNNAYQSAKQKGATEAIQLSHPNRPYQLSIRSFSITQQGFVQNEELYLFFIALEFLKDSIPELIAFMSSHRDDIVDHQFGYNNQYGAIINYFLLHSNSKTNSDAPQQMTEDDVKIFNYSRIVVYLMALIKNIAQADLTQSKSRSYFHSVDGKTFNSMTKITSK